MIEKMASETFLCLNSERLARVPCSKIILEEVIPKLAIYLKVKMRINMLKLSDCVVYFANKCIVFMQYMYFVSVKLFNALMITAVIIKIHSGASLIGCFNFEAIKTENWIFVLFWSFV